jgi:hypothetical protein
MANRLHNGSNGSEEQVELTEEYIDVGEADYYEPANAQRSSGYPQHLRVPKNEFQPQSSSSTYYVQRMPIQTQFIAPAVNPDFSHQMV